MLGMLFQNLLFKRGSKKTIYLDHAATTPLDPEVQRAMVAVMTGDFANPGAIHGLGIKTRLLINDARRSVAKLLGTTSNHIVFTRGGTESNNIAIQGVIARAVQKNQGSHSMGEFPKPHVISSVIEHAAVLETLKELERQQVIELTLVDVDATGIVMVDQVKEALRPETVLISIMYVNNEIGTIQPIREIAKLVRWYRKQLDRKPHHATTSAARNGNSVGTDAGNMDAYPLFHVDAIQAVNYLDIHVERLGVDLMSLSGSKIYGPKSSGVVFVRNLSLVAPMLFGGDQEFSIRPGTEDVVQVVGFTKALESVRAIADSEHERLKVLRDDAITSLEKNILDVVINGSRTDRVANNISFTIPGISGERLVIELDARGILCASKSACKEDSDEASHVLTALRRATVTDTDGAVRLSLGQGTTRADTQYAVESITDIVKTIRAFEKTISKK